MSTLCASTFYSSECDAGVELTVGRGFFLRLMAQQMQHA
jgi:hypothetical protein